ncbi:mechanosensitive ion channel family protein [Sphingobium sp. B2D3B]|uniref:mechanosensitive ion channel family protein n=2 Tax=Sphingomonadaceae TaxID=41297 RepID=UPI002224B7F6|nr:mechanosensitive ion channel family protein [Sphingobium sp. B2D3B]
MFPDHWTLPPLLESLMLGVLAVLAALALHWISVRVLRRLLTHAHSEGGLALLRRAQWPSRWLLVAFALAFLRPSLTLGERGHLIWSQAAAMIVPGLIGWLAVALIRGTQDVVEQRTDISVADNLRARRKRTRTGILGRIAVVLVIFITLCLMLFSIPSVRAVGVTLMASAGLAALAVGAAAQPLLKNVIAGIQLAFTEPIRIDDVVIIEGEWGKIEAIYMTYVVVAVWDERRLVVPISRFLEDSFQNWTRSTSQLLGSVFFHLDPTADIDQLRARYEAIVAASPLWDGRVKVLQVTEVRPDAIEVRGLASARNAGEAFDLRCEIREKVLAFIRDEMPQALPRHRGLLARDVTERVNAG